MYLWRRLATRSWWHENEPALHQHVGARLAIIDRLDGKRLQLEVASGSQSELADFQQRFGGRIRELPRDWLQRYARRGRTKPLKVGSRLIVWNADRGASARRTAGSKGPFHLTIPAGAAFGTGQHATTAMSLRILARLLCRPSVNRAGRLLVDLGTGSGILALACRLLGAKRAIGIDLDPMAVSTAKDNARRNKIGNVDFKIADLRRWAIPRAADIVTANLFSELLIELLPRLRKVRWLILSGVLRNQEHILVRALKRNKITVVEIRRRGKWIAVLAKN